MSKKNDDALVAFFNDIDWSQQVANEGVKKLMLEIQSKIESENSSGAEDMDLSNATRIKLVVVGDGAVGKTSLLISFQTKKFPTTYVPTVFENYTAPMKRENGRTPVLLHLWDTAGQEEYDRLRPLSYPNSDVVLLCFSTVNRGSFESVKIKWFPEVNHYLKDVPKLLVGTKVDLRDSGTADPHASEYEPIPKTEGDALVKELGVSKYVEVSAKTRLNLNKVFETAVDCVIGHKEANEGGSSSSSGASQSTTTTSTTKTQKAAVTSSSSSSDDSKRHSKRCIMM